MSPSPTPARAETSMAAWINSSMARGVQRHGADAGHLQLEHFRERRDLVEAPSRFLFSLSAISARNADAGPKLADHGYVMVIRMIRYDKRESITSAERSKM
jgi:hypothetical protein